LENISKYNLINLKVRWFIFLGCECKCNIVILGLVKHKLTILEIFKKNKNPSKNMKKTSSTIASLLI
jgi:hypothetical protein